jgi:hypothetical protein
MTDEKNASRVAVDGPAASPAFMELHLGRISLPSPSLTSCVNSKGPSDVNCRINKKLSEHVPSGQ